MMGCTSSAPNMPEIVTSTAETTENNQNIPRDDFNEDNDVIQGTTENESNDVKVSKTEVLPTCDSLEENIQLARNTNSFTKKDNEGQENDVQFSSVVENDETESEDKNGQNKFTTIKEVADKVILNNILDEIDNISILSDEKSNKDEKDVADTEQVTSEVLEGEELEDSKSQQNIEESASPSQSDGSRSTRWEALADIAAELPPSLAVDPITGQIYSLTK